MQSDGCVGEFALFDECMDRAVQCVGLDFGCLFTRVIMHKEVELNIHLVVFFLD